MSSLSRRPHNCKTGHFTSQKERERLRNIKNENCTCKACKTIVFHNQICKFVTFLLPSLSWCVSSLIGSLRSYDGNWNKNFTLKLNFALRKVFCDYSMLVTLYKIGAVHFRLLGTNIFHVTAKNERFTAASSRCRQNVKYENFTLSFGRLRQNIAPKACCTCSTISFLRSTNQIIDLWRCRWRRQILNSLM